MTFDCPSLVQGLHVVDCVCNAENPIASMGLAKKWKVSSLQRWERVFLNHSEAACKKGWMAYTFWLATTIPSL